MMTGRASLPRGLALFLACLGLLLAGCGDSRERAYSKGWNEGYEEGFAEGRKDGAIRAEAGHQGKWGLLGLVIGGALGAAMVAFATRRHLAAQWRGRQRRKELERFVGTCKADLDPDLHEEILAIARKKAALEDLLEQDDGPLIAALHDRLRPEFVRLDTRLLELAALLQQLRDLRRATESNPAHEQGRRRPPPLDGELKEITALRDLKERRRNELQKNADNIARCESQLAGFATFLDELQMRLGNLKTLEQADAFERFEKDAGEEIDALGTVFEATLANLTREM